MKNKIKAIKMVNAQWNLLLILIQRYLMQLSHPKMIKYFVIVYKLTKQQHILVLSHDLQFIYLKYTKKLKMNFH